LNRNELLHQVLLHHSKGTTNYLDHYSSVKIMVTHYNDSSVTKSNRKYCSKSYKNLSKAYNDL